MTHLKQPSQYVRTVQAAEYLSMSPRTLEKCRVNGGGPKFRKFGRRVLYAIADLEAWANARVCQSTSDANYPRAKGHGDL